MTIFFYCDIQNTALNINRINRKRGNNVVKIEKYLMASILTRKLGALASFRSQMDAVQRDQASLAETLMLTAPKKMRKLLEEEGIIRNLLDYGQSIMKIGNGYGFKTPSQMKKAFTALELAWKGNVAILAIEEAGRLDVTLRVRFD